MSTDAACPHCGHARWRGVRQHLQADITRFLNKSPENQALGDNFKRRLGALLTPQLLCLLCYRIAHALHLRGWRRLASVLVRLNALLQRVHLSADSCIGGGCLLPHPAGVFFVGHAGPGLTLYAMAVCTPVSPSPVAPASSGPQIGARVTLGVHSVLQGPVTVGDDVRIGPRVSVAAPVPPGRMALPRQWRARRLVVPT
ncbi:MAG: hypothetical protein Q8M96_24090, partial [Rubrivivax sp.]|nr:hypothetical protein [Rubrivivax sp.]